MITAGRDARYVPTGHLVYALNGVIFGVRFDASRIQVIGRSVSLIEGVGDALNVTGAAQFSGRGAQEYTISAGGGTEPLWASSGRELLYRHSNDLMSVAVSASAGALIAPPPVRLFSGDFVLDASTTRTVANYDISRDGKRFLTVKTVPVTATAPPPINVALNWTEELKQRVPTK